MSKGTFIQFFWGTPNRIIVLVILPPIAPTQPDEAEMIPRVGLFFPKKKSIS